MVLRDLIVSLMRGSCSTNPNADLTTFVNLFTAGLSGAAPASGGGTTTYLRADGTWATLPGSFSGFANPSASVGLAAVNGVATTAMRSDAAPPLSQSIAPTWTGNHTFTPGSGVGGTFNGAANQYCVSATGSPTSGQSFGLLSNAGTTSADAGLTVNNQANSTTYFKVRGDGKILGGGTTAAALVDMTPDTGTFSGTLTGLTTSPTVSCSWARIGNVVVLTINKTNSSVTGTSNATSFTMTGLPSEIQPATSNTAGVTLWGFEDNSGATSGTVYIPAATSTVTFFKGSSGSGSSWTSSNLKGIIAPITIAYNLN